MKTVLLVDDDPVFVNVATKALTRAGWTVLPTSNSHTAIALIDERPDIDLLIADIRMPAGQPHGISLANMVRRQRSNLPILLVTVHAPYAQIEGDFGEVLLKDEGIEALVDAALRKLSAIC